MKNFILILATIAALAIVALFVFLNKQSRDTYISLPKIAGACVDDYVIPIAEIKDAALSKLAGVELVRMSKEEALKRQMKVEAEALVNRHLLALAAKKAGFEDADEQKAIDEFIFAEIGSRVKASPEYLDAYYKAIETETKAHTIIFNLTEEGGEK